MEDTIREILSPVFGGEHEDRQFRGCSQSCTLGKPKNKKREDEIRSLLKGLRGKRGKEELRKKLQKELLSHA